MCSRGTLRGLGVAFFIVIAASGAGCGDSNGGADGAARGEVAQMYADVAAADGFDVDPVCVQQILGAMSDDDVAAIQDAGLEGSAELSEAGFGVLNDVANQCVDVQQYIGALMEDLAVDPQLNPDANLDCVEAELRKLTSIDQVDRELPNRIIVCSNPA